MKTKSFPNILKQAIVAAATAWLPLFAQQSGIQPGCYNQYDPGKYCEDCENGEPTTYWWPSAISCPAGGVNPVNVASGSVQRTVSDISANGGVGQHRLNWTRFGQSRFISGEQHFGDGHGWRHSYQWEMTDVDADTVRITEPNGTRYQYNKSGANWVNESSTNQNTFTQNGIDYYLTNVNGQRFHFQKLGSGTFYYQLQDFTDGFGRSYYCTYNASKRLVLISEPGGRWLRVNYQDITVNRSAFVPLATVPNVAPTANAWTEIAVSDTNTYRFLRYYSSDVGQVESHCNVAEVEFYDISNVKLAGTKFGANPPKYNDPALAFGAAQDGNTTTYYNYAYKHIGFTGLDLGTGNEKRISKVRFFPRAGSLNDRMRLGRFEGSNELPVVKTVIESVDIGYGSGAAETITNSVAFAYQLLPDTVLETDWLVLSKATYGDAAEAQYSYQILWPGQRPLLATMDDPRVQGKATQLKYEFWTNAYVHGSIYAERDLLTNTALATFVGVGSDDASNTGRKVTYANGSNREFTLGASHRVASLIDALGRTVTFNFGGGGFVVSSTDSANRTTSYTRDSKGRLISTILPDSTTRSWTRNGGGHVLTETDERGKITTYTRDSGTNRITRIDYPDSSYETFTNPNALGLYQTHRLQNGGVEQSTFDSLGRVVVKTDAAGYTTTYVYNAQERVESVTQSVLSAAYNSVTSTYTYNDRGHILTTEYFDSIVTSVYDAYGNRTSMTDGNLHTTTATYDSYKRKRTDTNAMGETTQYDYDEMTSGGSCCGGGGAGDHLTTITLPSGKKTRILYDSVGQKTSETSGFGTADTATTSYHYNSAGLVDYMTDPRGKIWNYSYDARGRRKTMTTPATTTIPAATTTWNYDAAGNVLSIVRPDTGTTVNTYDNMNRVLTTKDSANQVTTFEYGRLAPNDGGSTLHKMTDARGKTHTFLYDLRNQKTAMLYPDGTSESWGYDGAGNITYKSERPGGTGSIVWNYYYDPRNRETNRISSGGDPGIQPSWTDTYYYPTGIPAVIYNESSTIAYILDDADRVTAELQDIYLVAGSDPGPVLVNYTYDVDGNRQTITYPGGTSLAYTYTGRNQVDTITAGTPPPLVDYTYDESGNRTGKTVEPGTAAQTDTTYHYDNAGRLDWLDHKKGSASFARFDYTLNSVNNRTDRTETLPGSAARRDHYEYTADDQLDTVKYNWNQGASTQDRLVDYNFDAVGNRVSVADSAAPTRTFTVNDANQYGTATSTAGVETFIYMDTGAAGNRGNLFGVASNMPGSLTQKFKYDHVGRLIKTWKEDGTGGQFDAQLYYYDGRNRCVARNVVLNYGGTNQSVAGVRTMTYDGWNLIEETKNSVSTTYIHGAGVDEILATMTNGNPLYHHHDGLGSVVALTDANGAVVERYRYDVFGKPAFYTGANAPIAGATQSPLGNRFLYTGREQLTDLGADSLGLMDYRNRVYSTGIGRFLQTDPIRFDAEDVNLYRYASNLPTLFGDILGLWPTLKFDDCLQDEKNRLKWAYSRLQKALNNAQQENQVPHPQWSNWINSFRESKAVLTITCEDFCCFSENIADVNFRGDGFEICPRAFRDGNKATLPAYLGVELLKLTSGQPIGLLTGGIGEYPLRDWLQTIAGGGYPGGSYKR